jgi:hypothetical protein
MALYSTSFKNLVLNNDGHAHILTNVVAGGTAGAAHTGLGKLYIYAGTDPLSADAALSGQTLLCMLTSDAGVGSTFLSFSPASSGVISIHSGEVWSVASILATGTASYARFVQGAGDPTVADAGGSSTATPRAHLTIRQLGSPPGDINLSSTAFVATNPFTLNSFQLNIP